MLELKGITWAECCPAAEVPQDPLVGLRQLADSEGRVGESDAVPA